MKAPNLHLNLLHASERQWGASCGGAFSRAS